MCIPILVMELSPTNEQQRPPASLVSWAEVPDNLAFRRALWARNSGMVEALAIPPSQAVCKACYLFIYNLIRNMEALVSPFWLNPSSIGTFGRWCQGLVPSCKCRWTTPSVAGLTDRSPAASSESLLLSLMYFPRTHATRWFRVKITEFCFLGGFKWLDCAYFIMFCCDSLSLFFFICRQISFYGA